MVSLTLAAGRRASAGAKGDLACASWLLKVPITKAEDVDVIWAIADLLDTFLGKEKARTGEASRSLPMVRTNMSGHFKKGDIGLVDVLVLNALPPAPTCSHISQRQYRTFPAILSVVNFPVGSEVDRMKTDIIYHRIMLR